jgi:hypothetical protein
MPLRDEHFRDEWPGPAELEVPGGLFFPYGGYLRAVAHAALWRRWAIESWDEYHRLWSPL